MTSIAAPICVDCKHFRPSDDGLVCKAYPLGIPDAILHGEHDHHAQYPGDHGLLFKPRHRKPKERRLLPN